MNSYNNFSGQTANEYYNQRRMHEYKPQTPLFSRRTMLSDFDMTVEYLRWWFKQQNVDSNPKRKRRGGRSRRRCANEKSENNVLTSAENSVYFKVNETQLTKAAHQNECTHVISYLSSWNRSPYNRQLYKSCVWVCDYFFSLCLPFNFRFMYENFLKACGCINVTSVTAISGNRP